MNDEKNKNWRSKPKLNQIEMECSTPDCDNTVMRGKHTKTPRCFTCKKRRKNERAKKYYRKNKNK